MFVFEWELGGGGGGVEGEEVFYEFTRMGGGTQAGRERSPLSLNILLFFGAQPLSAV